MRYKLEYTSTYEKMRKKCFKDNTFPVDKYEEALNNLQEGTFVNPLGQKHVVLRGKLKSYTDNSTHKVYPVREYWIDNVWRILFCKKKKELILVLLKVGTHKDVGTESYCMYGAHGYFWNITMTS